MSTTPLPPRDDTFEDEVRAMLTRRAADVSPSPAAVPSGDTPACAAAGEAPHRAARPRTLAAAAAVVVLLAGVVTFGIARDSAERGADTSMVAGANDPIVWPLHDDVPPIELAAPETAAAAYLSEVAGDGELPTLEAPVVDGDRATVGYLLRDTHGEVELRLDGSRWGVTAASSDAVRIEAVPVVAGQVEVMTVLGDAVAGGAALHTSSVGADGTATLQNTTSVVPLSAGASVQLEATDESATTLLLPPDDVSARSIAIDFPAGSPPPVAVRVDVMAADDGDPGSPEVVIGHAARAVDAPAVVEEDESAASSTVVTAEPEGSDRRTHLTVPPGGSMHVEGSYSGTESFGPTTGRCPDLDHELGATLTLTDGTVWELDSSYCGTLAGDDWTGLGQFSLTTSSGDTLIGPLTSTATLPTDGEPFTLQINNGTGAYAGALGSCILDNHVRPLGEGLQEQSGTFTCDIGGVPSTSP